MRMTFRISHISQAKASLLLTLPPFRVLRLSIVSSKNQEVKNGHSLVQ